MIPVKVGRLESVKICNKSGNRVARNNLDKLWEELKTQIHSSEHDLKLPCSTEPLEVKKPETRSSDPVVDIKHNLHKISECLHLHGHEELETVLKILLSTEVKSQSFVPVPFVMESISLSLPQNLPRDLVKNSEQLLEKRKHLDQLLQDAFPTQGFWKHLRSQMQEVVSYLDQVTGKFGKLNHITMGTYVIKHKEILKEFQDGLGAIVSQFSVKQSEILSEIQDVYSALEKKNSAFQGKHRSPDSISAQIFHNLFGHEKHAFETLLRRYLVYLDNDTTSSSSSESSKVNLFSEILEEPATNLSEFKKDLLELLSDLQYRLFPSQTENIAFWKKLLTQAEHKWLQYYSLSLRRKALSTIMNYSDKLSDMFRLDGEIDTLRKSITQLRNEAKNLLQNEITTPLGDEDGIHSAHQLSIFFTEFNNLFKSVSNMDLKFWRMDENTLTQQKYEYSAYEQLNSAMCRLSSEYAELIYSAGIDFHAKVDELHKAHIETVARDWEHFDHVSQTLEELFEKDLRNEFDVPECKSFLGALLEFWNLLLTNLVARRLESFYL